MTTTLSPSSTASPPATPLTVVALHFSKRTIMILVPLIIVFCVLVVSALIAVVFLRAGSAPGSAEWVDGSRNNQGMLWGLAGFMVYLGVQSVSTTFPFALALGSTRRAFTLGTLATHALLAAYITAVYLALLAVEKLTGQWFVGFHLVDVYILGAGDPVRLTAIAFLGVLTALSVGAAFASVWVRFGNRGPMVMAAALVLATLVALILLVPYLAQIAAAFELWWLAVAAIVVILGSVLIEYGCLRRATAR